MTANPLKPLDPGAFDQWKARHLLTRAGFGGTTSQAQALADLGFEAAVDYIVNYEDIATPAPVTANDFESGIMRPPTSTERQNIRRARQSGDESMVEKLRLERQRRQKEDRRQIAEMQEWWLRRMIETPRPLEEKLTLFWHGHFATGYRTIEDSYHMFLQNVFLRTNACGNFKDDLVRGIIRDPAMIEYLDNDQNRKQAPNENLARELMELFTLGEGQGYTEDDIKQGARALTGYTYNDDQFVFRAGSHDDGVKSILGSRGQYDGDDFVDLIFARPSATEYILWKMYRFFVNDLPQGETEKSTTFVKALAREFRRRRWAVKPVLRAIFLSEHFYDPVNDRAVIKSPIQLIVQAVRTLNPPNRRQLLRTLITAGDLMGQRLFFPPSVKGWDGGRAWVNTSTMFMRHNTLLFLLTGQRPDGYAWEADSARFDAMAHLPEGMPTPERVIDHLLQVHLGTPTPPSDRKATLRDYLRGRGDRIDNATLTGMFTLITTMPEYQLS